MATAGQSLLVDEQRLGHRSQVLVALFELDEERVVRVLTGEQILVRQASQPLDLYVLVVTQGSGDGESQGADEHDAREENGKASQRIAGPCRQEVEKPAAQVSSHGNLQSGDAECYDTRQSS